jgi:NADH dehydrogenase
MRHESILLIGGTGFIGTAIAARLVAAGKRVIVPTRRFTRARHLQVLPTVQIVEADVFNEAQLSKLLAQVDAVINLVGVLHSRPGDPWGPAFEHAHVALPRLLARTCVQQGVKRVLQMSALGADTNGPSMYSRSKAAGERILLDAEGLQVTSFRPSVVFGPDDKFLNTFAKLQAIAPLMAVGGVDTKFQPVYVGDVAQAFADALDDVATIGQVYELVGPHVYTLRELVQLAGQYSGHRRPVIGLPDTVARVQAFVLEHLPGPTLMSRDNLDSMKADNVASAQYPLPRHWKPTPIEAVAPGYLHPNA